MSAIAEGSLEPPGGVIRHRGQEGPHGAFKGAIQSVERELRWPARAAEIEPGAWILAARLANNPDETFSLRTQQGATKGAQHRAVCESQTAQARAVTANADLQYLAARCNTDDEARNRAYLEGRRKWPQNVWFAYAWGITLAEKGSNGEALTALAVSWRNAPPLAETAALMAARHRRKEARNDRGDIRDLFRGLTLA